MYGMVIADSISHYLKHVLHPNYFLHGIDFGFKKMVCLQFHVSIGIFKMAQIKIESYYTSKILMHTLLNNLK
jgi:hypothetical protein